MTDEKLCIPRPEADWARCLPKFYPCKLEDDRLKLAEYLVKLAQKGGSPFTYTEIGEKIGLERNDSTLFTHLGALSWVTYRNKKVFLSVLVVRASEQIPGDGFFKMVAGFREKPYIESANNDSFIDERDRVYKIAKEGELDFMLTGKTLKD